jgi:hypothetical protein
MVDTTQHYRARAYACPRKYRTGRGSFNAKPRGIFLIISMLSGPSLELLRWSRGRHWVMRIFCGRRQLHWDLLWRRPPLGVGVLLCVRFEASKFLLFPIPRSQQEPDQSNNGREPNHSHANTYSNARSSAETTASTAASTASPRRRWRLPCWSA